MEEGSLDLTGQVVASALKPVLADSSALKPVLAGPSALKPVLADPSGRRARILGVVSTAVIALLLAWLLGLVVVGPGILPLAGLPLERLLGHDPSARAPVPVASQPHVVASRNILPAKFAGDPPVQAVTLGFAATRHRAQDQAGGREFRLGPPTSHGLTSTTRPAAYRALGHRSGVARHRVAITSGLAAQRPGSATARAGTATAPPGATAAQARRRSAAHGAHSRGGSAPPRGVSRKAQAAPGQSHTWAIPGAGRGRGGSEKAYGKES
jgi:hypothetical protein